MSTEWFEDNKDAILSEADKIRDDLLEEAVELLEKRFLQDTISFSVDVIELQQRAGYYKYRGKDWFLYEDCFDLSIDTWEQFVEKIEQDGFEEEDIAEVLDRHQEFLTSIIFDRYCSSHREINWDDFEYYDDTFELISDNCDYYSVIEKVNERITIKRIEELLRCNPHYKDMFSQLEEAEKRRIKEEEEYQRKRKEIAEAIKDTIPGNPVDYFPLARKMHRKVFLHIGPTNSGKTHAALQRLQNAENGLYLAPLRLMAHEIYEKLNAAGVPCSLETSEEVKLISDATHSSKTIEMFHSLHQYQVAVIDEAQMIADKDRGGAWTNVIMGVLADEVHICMSPNAESIVRHILNLCGDSVTVVRHERKTELVAEREHFSFPNSVQKGDALIVFSRKHAIFCVAELQEQGFRCSIIYGALPYKVRHNEVRKYLDGETDVVVATDAIGMGMNLPIRRIVFLETQKYDGSRKRKLNTEEVKQIAGRAGRFGMYDTGYFNSEYEQNAIEKLFYHPDIEIQKAILSFPESAISGKGSVSEIIREWTDIKAPDRFRKADTTNLLQLVQEIEKMTDDKIIVYSLSTIPFSVKDEQLYAFWKMLSRQFIDDGRIDIQSYVYSVQSIKEFSLEQLEDTFRRYDLLYAFAKRMKDTDSMQLLEAERERVSETIIERLKNRKMKRKVCKYCKTVLQWNYPYSICSICYDSFFY
ncbi:MAG: DEAD/DEAH box helicase [Lachnospiraceae bacterium]|nr:DEAD/DEAH box helicase [Lachnospiraceae bacterium]